MTSPADQVTDDSWRDFRGHSYRYFTDGSVSSRQAAEQCYQEGGLLLSMNDETEFDFIKSEILRGRTLSAFIGGTDVQEGIVLNCECCNIFYCIQQNVYEGHFINTCVLNIEQCIICHIFSAVRLFCV